MTSHSVTHIHVHREDRFVPTVQFPLNSKLDPLVEETFLLQFDVGWESQTSFLIPLEKLREVEQSLRVLLEDFGAIDIKSRWASRFGASLNDILTRQGARDLLPREEVK